MDGEKEELAEPENNKLLLQLRKQNGNSGCGSSETLGGRTGLKLGWVELVERPFLGQTYKIFHFTAFPHLNYVENEHLDGHNSHPPTVWMAVVEVTAIICGGFHPWVFLGFGRGGGLGTSLM